MLSLSGCETAEEPPAPVAVDLAQTSDFDVTITGEALPESNFLPLKTVTEWTYELVHADADTAANDFPFPTTFTVTLKGIREFAGKRYQTVENYRVPGAKFPAPAPMRIDDDQIYVLIDNQEYLLYSFDGDLSEWTVPLNMGSETTEDRTAEMVNLTEGSAVISWGLSGFPGVDRPKAVGTETGWAEVFNPGLGRVRVVSVTEEYGLTVWDLQEIRFNDAELVFPEPNPNSYYPLQLGNTWVYYNIGCGYTNYRITGGQLINDTLYYELSYSALYREGSGIIYSRLNDVEYVLLDPEKPINEPWYTSRTVMSEIISKTDTVFSDTGPIFNCIRIKQISSGAETVHCPSVGRVIRMRYSSFCEPMLLQYAVIDGDTISFDIDQLLKLSQSN